MEALGIYIPAIQANRPPPLWCCMKYDNTDIFQKQIITIDEESEITVFICFVNINKSLDNPIGFCRML